MAHEFPKQLVQSLRRPFYLLDAESERPVADTLFRPDGGPIAAEIKRRWNAHEQLVAALHRLTNEVTGCWGMSEAYLRHELGNTNYQCVADKLAEALAALALDATTGE